MDDFKNEALKRGWRHLGDDKGRLILATASVLILGDLFFIFLHILRRIVGFPESPQFKITMDRGFGELYQYAKIASILALLVWLFVRSHLLAYFSLFCLFFYLLLDDALQIHELFGGWLASRYQLPELPGLRSIDLGELLVSGVMGVILIGLLMKAFLVSPPREKLVCWDVVRMIMLLAFFGVVVDMIHIVFIDWPLIASALGALEDGGEMVVMSVILAYVCSLASGNVARWGEGAPGT